MSVSQASRPVLPSAMNAPESSEFPRVPGSIRRTSHVDMIFGALGLGIRGFARDLVTFTEGHQVVDEAEMSALLDPAKSLVNLDSIPERPLHSLLGRLVGSGFRDAVQQAVPDDVAQCSALALLLDDLPVAALISGYTLLYTDSIPGAVHANSVKADICSGWRTGGTMMASIGEYGRIPVPAGPPVPPMDTGGDPLGWHTLEPLGPSAMRRRRMVDITVGSALVVRAMFRDTHSDTAGTETVLHEYSLTATIDAATSRFITCDAIPRVLPWVECPVAAASATRLVGHHVADVRSLVRSDLRGTSTCTHLNDLIRSLGDIDALAATYEAHVAATGSPSRHPQH